MAYSKEQRIINSLKPPIVDNLQSPVSNFVLPNLSGMAGYNKDASFNMIRVKDTYHAFGGFQDQNLSLSISGANVWTKITNGTGDLFQGMEATGMSLVNDTLVFAKGGDYTGSLTLTFSALLGKDYHLRVFNITQNKQMGYVLGVTTTGATNYTSITLPLYLDVNAGDVLELQIECTTDGTDPTLEHCVFYVSYIHE